MEAEYEKQIDAGQDGSPAYARGVLAMIILFNTAMALGWGPLQVTYVVEILPYNLRARVSQIRRHIPTISRAYVFLGLGIVQSLCGNGINI